MSLNTIRQQWASDLLAAAWRRSFPVSPWQCPHAQNQLHKDSFPSLVWKNPSSLQLSLLLSSSLYSPLRWSLLLSSPFLGSPPLIIRKILIFAINSDEASVTLILHSGFPLRNTVEGNDTVFYIDCICPEQSSDGSFWDTATPLG